MKKIFGLLSLLFLLNSTLSAQVRHGVHILAGIAKLQNSSEVVYPEPTVSEVLDNFDFSWTIGYEASLVKDNGFALQVGLDVLLLNAKRQESVFTRDSDYANFDGEYSVSYIGLPFLVGFKINNIGLLTGPRASLFLAGSFDSVSMGEVDGVAFMNTNSGELIQLDRLDFGHHTELNYGMGDDLEVVLSYYYGFGALAGKPNPGNYYQQISIGLAYLFN